MMRKGRLLLAFFVCIIIVAFATISQAKPKNFFQFIPVVDIYKVKKTKVDTTLTYPARLKSYKDVVIKAQVGGILLKRFFKEGSFVKKGEKLFLIDPRIYQAKLESLKAQLKAALANLTYSKANYKRVEKSFKENLISADKRDLALYQYKSAEATVQNLMAQIKQAEVYLSYTTPTSPINGFARIRYVDAGNLINIGEPLVEIVKINPIYAEFGIPDTDIPLVLKNTKHLKPILIAKNTKITGRIDFIDRKINPQTQTLKMRAIFKNSSYKLLPNEFVRVKLKGIYEENKVLIPQQAVLQTANGPIVYLIVKNKVIPKPIKITDQYKNYFVVKGLKTGSIIAVDNLLKLRPNTQVKIGKQIK